MEWYDFFAAFYDRTLEHLYEEHRRAAAEALELRPGLVVLDLPCGTGQSFEFVASAIGPDGALIGIDRSHGMLERARARIDRAQLSNTRVHEHDVLASSSALITEILGSNRPVDRILVFLGFTAFPDWERAFAVLWQLLASGGRMVIVDVHAERPTFQGKMVNLIARADIRRRVWLPLENVAERFERIELPSRREHGGQIFMACGSKPTNEHRS